MTNFYEDFWVAEHLTGSNYICNPPVTDTDIDTVILARPGYEGSLMSLGWQYQTSEVEYDGMGAFQSYRKDNRNYIVTTDPRFYQRFVAATKAAKVLNLKDKQKRIELFQYILYQL
jgi:hypothetical protein